MASKKIIYCIYKKGFTLVELMVVISIISALSSVILTATQQSREKAQISKFIQEMNQLYQAVELYKSNKNVYPDSLSGSFGLPLWSGSGTGQDDFYNQLFANQLIGKKIDIPSFIYIYPQTPGIIFSPLYSTKTNTYNQNYNCGRADLNNTIEHEVIIHFCSSKDLPFSRLYYSTSATPTDFPNSSYKCYCIAYD